MRTIMEESAVNEFSDAGSIPASSISHKMKRKTPELCFGCFFGKKRNENYNMNAYCENFFLNIDFFGEL